MDTRALECLQILDAEPAIAGTASDNHRAGSGALVIGQVQLERLLDSVARRHKTDRLGWNRYVSPELLCLVVGAGHQRHTGDTGWKSQIVLNPRRGARLASEGTTIGDKHGKPFRRRVDRSS